LEEGLHYGIWLGIFEVFWLGLEEGFKLGSLNASG
jgi:hypothetical protein